jgi:hypothetical protein
MTHETIIKIITKKLLINDFFYLTKIDAINEVYAIFSKELKLFSHSFWLDLTDNSIGIFIENLTEINRAKLFYKFACIYALLGSNIIKSYGIEIVDSGGSKKLQLNGNIDITNDIVNRTSIEYYHLINHNDTLNKLFKIARSNLVTGAITLGLEDDVLKNKTLDLTQYFIQNVSKPSQGIDVFTDAEFKSGKFRTLTVNGIQIIDAVSFLLQIVDEEQRLPGGSADNHNKFKDKINRMYSDLKLNNSVIEMISTYDLEY